MAYQELKISMFCHVAVTQRDSRQSFMPQPSFQVKIDWREVEAMGLTRAVIIQLL